ILLSALSPTAVSAVHGTLHDRSAVAISGARVAVLGHPEFGSTRTRTDGAWDMVVNGAARLVFTFDKSGYLPVQRGLVPTGLDFNRIDDVVMIQVDSASTQVSLGSSSTQLARGTAQT